MKNNKLMCYQNRELSWLTFNERILEEANDVSVPLLERLRFLAIFESNLNEFYMIRVGSLLDLSRLKEPIQENKTNLTSFEQMEKIFARTKLLLKKKDQVYTKVMADFDREGFKDLQVSKLTSKMQEYYDVQAKKEILPLLSPQIVDPHHPFPHLQTSIRYLGLWMEKDGKSAFGILPIPDILPRLYFYENTKQYLPVEKLIGMHLKSLFAHYTIKEVCVFTITRNADIAVTEEMLEVDDDFLDLMKRLLKKRERLAAVKLEVGGEISENFQMYLLRQLNLKKNQIFKVHGLFGLFSVCNAIEKRLETPNDPLWLYQPFTPVVPIELTNKSMFKAIKERDQLLFYPFESFDPFLRFLREAANDPYTVSIKITIYRLANPSRLVDILCQAAENGKDVTVMMELRARFDEESNITYSKQLEESGCTILYGYEHYKTHAKLCLVTRNHHGKIEYFTQVGTGNYHEKTARLYTDYALLTANQSIGADAHKFFQNSAMNHIAEDYQALVVAPLQLKTTFFTLIDQEIEKAKRGEPANVFIKANSLTEKDMIDKLIEAGRANVHVRLMIRGICCLLPSSECTPNIEVHSIVGRFLEHSRIYGFGDTLYISSADPMTRNLQKRVEIATPIFDERVKKQIIADFELCWSDNVKGRILDRHGHYHRIVAHGEYIDSQRIFLNRYQRAQDVVIPKKGIFKKGLKKWLLKVISYLDKEE